MTVPTPVSPRSPALQLIGTLLAVAGLGLTVFLGAALGVPDAGASLTDALAGVVVWAGFMAAGLLPFALGVWLIGRGAPGVWRVLLHNTFAHTPSRDAASVPRPTLAGRLRWLLLDPVGLCVLLPVLTLVPAWMSAAGAMVAVLALTGFAVLHPALCAWRPPWWTRTALGALAFVATFVVLGSAPSVRDLREGAVVFMVPAMAYPAAIAASGVVRLARWLRRDR